jgi:hypothetical protein
MSAAGSAFSGVGEASQVWIEKCSAAGCFGSSASTEARVSVSSPVPGCICPSGVHRSHGRRFIIDSAKSAPTSALSGFARHTSRITAA